MSKKSIVKVVIFDMYIGEYLTGSLWSIIFIIVVVPCTSIANQSKFTASNLLKWHTVTHSVSNFPISKYVLLNVMIIKWMVNRTWRQNMQSKYVPGHFIILLLALSVCCFMCYCVESMYGVSVYWLPNDYLRSVDNGEMKKENNGSWDPFSIARFRCDTLIRFSWSSAFLFINLCVMSARWLQFVYVIRKWLGLNIIPNIPAFRTLTQTNATKYPYYNITGIHFHCSHI